MQILCGFLNLLIYVIGETLKIPFVMDQAVMEDNRLVTLSTPRPVSADDALEMIAGALEKYELIVEEKAGALHVMHKPPAPRPTMEIQSGSEINEGSGDVLHILPLKFLKVAEIQTLIADLSRGNIQIKPYSRENVIILHGESSQMKQIIDFINYFDVPSLQAKKVMFLRLTYWQPEEFITQLSKMLEGMGIAAAKTSREPGPVLIAVRQMNAVLAVAPDEITMKYILDWKDRLDTVEAAGSEEKAFTFAPQFSRASDIVDSLLKLYGISPRSENSSGSLSTTYQTTGQGFQIPSTDSQTANRIDISGKQFASGKLNASETGFSAASLPALKIAADNNKNIVIMICSPTVYRQHLDLLRQLDTQTKQVLIEAPRIDGAGDFFIYRKIVLPLSISSMAALAVLEFTWIWNDLLWSLILLQQDKLKTVTLGLANMQGEFITNYNMIAAGSIIASLPPLIVFLLFQRYFISGLTVGAEKA